MEQLVIGKRNFWNLEKLILNGMICCCCVYSVNLPNLQSIAIGDASCFKSGAFKLQSMNIIQISFLDLTNLSSITIGEGAFQEATEFSLKSIWMESNWRWWQDLPNLVQFITKPEAFEKLKNMEFNSRIVDKDH